MWNARNQKRICYFGMMLVITGSVSFSNHPRVGDILVLVGAVIVITMKIIQWRNRVKTA